MDKFQLTITILTALTSTVAVYLAALIQRQDVRDLRTGMLISAIKYTQSS